MIRLMQPPGKREDSCMFAKIARDQLTLAICFCILPGIFHGDFDKPLYGSL